MIAPGAKGSFPSSTDDATKPKNIIALSNPQTRTTGFQGTRMYMADLRGRRAAYDYLYYTAKRRRPFEDFLPESLGPGDSPGRENSPNLQSDVDGRKHAPTHRHSMRLHRDAWASRACGGGFQPFFGSRSLLPSLRVP